MLEGKWKTSGCLAMLSFRNEYCFFFFLRHIFMCGHFNAVLPSETCRTKTWAEGLATMYNQKPTSLPVSEWLVFNCKSRKARITVCHFQSNRSAGPRSAPITRRQIPWFPAPGLLHLASIPVLFPHCIPEASLRVNVCTGRSKYPAISTELFSFCWELQVSNAITGFKEKLTGEHKKH